jgi:D-alanine--poly(phosphoribitol) ligase subunit 2
MPDTAQIQQLVFQAIDDLNAVQPPGMTLEKSADTVLFGSGAKIDSLGLVNLVVATEQLLSSKLGKAVTLADERAFSQKKSPFRTVGTLVEYIAELTK